MRNHPRTRHLMATAAITAGLTAPFLAAAAPAFASGGGGGGGGVSSHGACTNGGRFELKAKHDDRAIEMEYQVDSNRAGQVWAVRITDNGAVAVSRNATTGGRSGSFTVRKVIPNRPGLDKIHARATFANHTCGGTVRL
ncbi:MAG TPA: hypothetical protein VGM53_21495 [Streptosporangiaceae bacterium]